MGLPFRAEPLDFWLGASKKMEKKFPAWVTQEKKNFPAWVNQKKNSLSQSIRKKKSLPMGKTSLSERWKEKKKNPCPLVEEKKNSLPMYTKKKNSLR